MKTSTTTHIGFALASVLAFTPGAHGQGQDVLPNIQPGNIAINLQACCQTLNDSIF